VGPEESLAQLRLAQRVPADDVPADESVDIAPIVVRASQQTKSPEFGRKVA
jgi:hypothetical protein